MSTTPVEGDVYRVMPVEAHRVVTVAEDQGLELGRTADGLVREVDAAAAAIGAGSPVTDALAELRTLHTDLAAGWAATVDSAARGAREAIDAYVAADLEMERQFDDFLHGRGIHSPPGSFVVPPTHPPEPFIGPVAPR
ncbi:MAG: DUF6507 family protein [Dermatophilaceae bacterium]